MLLGKTASSLATVQNVVGWSDDPIGQNNTRGYIGGLWLGIVGPC